MSSWWPARQMRIVRKIVTMALRAVPEKVLLAVARRLCADGRYCYAALLLASVIKRNMDKSGASRIQLPGEARKDFLSLIIPTYNREKSLERLFHSLERQQLQPELFEIICVNNGSTDGTAALCERYAQRLPTMRLVHEPRSGLLYARNAGVRAAVGDILVLCDDDIEAPPTWLASIRELMVRRPEIMLLGGNNIGCFEGTPPEFVSTLWEDVGHGIQLNSYYSLIENIPHGMVAPSQGYVMGCNFATRRAVVEAAGGFGPDCMQHLLLQGDGENRVGAVAETMGIVWLDPKVSVRHWMPAARLTTEYLSKRKRYFAIDSAYCALRNYDFRHWKNGDAASHIQNTYLSIAASQADMRKWISRQHYFDDDLPHVDFGDTYGLLSQRNGW